VKKVVIAVVCMAAAAGAVWAFWPSQEDVAAEIVLQPLEVEIGSIMSTLFVDGVVQAGLREELRSRSSGMIEEIFAEPGQPVSEGELLLSLVSDDLEHHVDRARAAVRRSLEELRDAEINAILREVEVPLQIEQASERLAFWQEQWEEAQSSGADEHELARLETEIDRAQLIFRRASGLDRLDAAREALQEAEYELQSALRDLEQRNIRAPFDGVVVSVSVGVNQSITASTLLMVIVDYSFVEIMVEIDEFDVRVVRPGQQVMAVADAYPDQTFFGRVTRISEEADRSNIVTFPTYVRVDNPDEFLRPGMTIEAEIITQRRDEAVLVPLAAIIRQEGNAYVKVKGDDGDELRPVQVGMQNISHAQILEGVTPGEKVLISGGAATATHVETTAPSVSSSDSTAFPTGIPSTPSAPSGGGGQGSGQGRTP